MSTAAAGYRTERAISIQEEFKVKRHQELQIKCYPFKKRFALIRVCLIVESWVVCLIVCQRLFV